MGIIRDSGSTQGEANQVQGRRNEEGRGKERRGGKKKKVKEIRERGIEI